MSQLANSSTRQHEPTGQLINPTTWANWPTHHYYNMGQLAACKHRHMCQGTTQSRAAQSTQHFGRNESVHCRACPDGTGKRAQTEPAQGVSPSSICHSFSAPPNKSIKTWRKRKTRLLKRGCRHACTSNIEAASSQSSGVSCQAHQ